MTDLETRPTVSDFETLGIAPLASAAHARAAWLTLVRAHHPDTAADPERATLRLAEINAAYDRVRRLAPRQPQTAEVPDTGRTIPGMVRQSGRVAVGRAQESMMLQSLLDEARKAVGLRGRIGIAARSNLPGMHVVREVEVSKGLLQLHFTTTPLQGDNLIALPCIAAYPGDKFVISPDRHRTLRIVVPTTPRTTIRYKRAMGFVTGHIDVSVELSFTGQSGDLRPEFLSRIGLRALLSGGKTAYHRPDVA